MELFCVRGGIQTTLPGIKQWLTPQVLRKGVIKPLVSENSQNLVVFGTDVLIAHFETL